MNRPRASACRNAPPAAWKSRSVGRRRRNDRASVPSRYGQRGRRTERTPPVGKQGAGVGGADAAVGKRRRERDAELQIQTPRLTVRRYEKWGNEHPGPGDRGRSAATSRSAVARKACVCARWSAVRGQRRHKRARVGFFHPHPPSVAAQGTAAGRKGGPISSASGSFSSLCWSWGRRARRRRRGTARARRGERHRPCGAARGHAQGRETDCAAGAVIRAEGET